MKNGELLTELNLLFSQGIEFVEPTDLSGAIRGRHNLYSHMETRLKSAQKSIVLMTTSKGLIRKADSLKPVLERMNKKGVKIRIVAPINNECKSVAKEFSKIAEVKSCDEKKLAGRFALIDGKELMFMVMDDEKVHPSYDVAVWVSTPYFASAMDNLFNLAWKDMTPLSKIKF